ncbi:4-galactosyl-N-acetylglucosaminide 3-alpha-L-fucosyltransferase FUT5-like [Diadema antillarum]|uniref:4-galactosyl-N-acetylglucosaminide 3-alpha-L-fucosyltransferase FUT5-like n=1 Tax=Diadema antillarum TaxID=105358 RepID=UPI003A8B4D04
MTKANDEYYFSLDLQCRRFSATYALVAFIVSITVCFVLLQHGITPYSVKQTYSFGGTFLRNHQDLDEIDDLSLGLPNRNGERTGETKRIYIHSKLEAILTWRELENLVDCVRVDGSKTEAKPCPVQCPSGDRLEITMDSDLDKARDKDAVIVGLSPYTMNRPLEAVVNYEPPPGQLVVFYSMENVMRMHHWQSRLGKFKFHIDLTYGYYSNITVPYGYYQPVTGKVPDIKPKNRLAGKTKLIAWMASNCKETFWPRNEFVAELQRHIDVDTYGRCGQLQCQPRLSLDCSEMLSSYKFYLALENSECNDYLSEKIWNSSLENDVIPVVYGPSKADYEKLAPPNSFIHISDFDTVEELAKYIKRVAEDEKLYNSYFYWREQGKVVQVYPRLQLNYFCKLLPYMKNVPNTMIKLEDSGWYNSCRNKLQHGIPINLTTLHQFDNWKPW